MRGPATTARQRPVGYHIRREPHGDQRAEQKDVIRGSLLATEVARASSFFTVLLLEILKARYIGTSIRPLSSTSARDRQARPLTSGKARGRRISAVTTQVEILSRPRIPQTSSEAVSKLGFGTDRRRTSEIEHHQNVTEKRRNPKAPTLCLSHNCHTTLSEERGRCVL